MALNTLEALTITRGAVAARKLLEELKPILDGLNVLYNTATIGVKFTVDQADLDSAANLSGLTTTQLEDAMYVLAGTVKDALTNGYTALAQLAARA